MTSGSECVHNEIVHVTRTVERRIASWRPDRVTVYGSDDVKTVTERWIECVECGVVVDTDFPIRFT